MRRRLGPRRCAMPRLLWHVLIGVVKTATVFRWANPERKQALIRAWSSRLLYLCGMELRVHTHGEVLTSGAMVVSNHVSWIDIYVINAWRPTPFVAKSEIASWPVIGWLAKSIGTVFIQRQRRGDAMRIVTALSDVLRRDGVICLFPEGTTSDGLNVAPFHANILQAAVTADAPVQPICLMYEDAFGRQSVAPAFVGDMSLADSLKRVLHGGPTIAHLHISAPLPALTDRRSASAQAYEAVFSALRHLQSQVAAADEDEVKRLQAPIAAAPAAVPTPQ